MASQERPWLRMWFLVLFNLLLLPLEFAAAQNTNLLFNPNCNPNIPRWTAAVEQAFDFATVAQDVLGAGLRLFTNNGQVDDRYARLFFFFFGAVDAGTIATVHHIYTDMINVLHNNPMQIGASCDVHSENLLSLPPWLQVQLEQAGVETYPGGDPEEPYEFLEEEGWVAVWPDGQLVIEMRSVNGQRRSLLSQDFDGKQPTCPPEFSAQAAMSLNDFAICEESLLGSDGGVTAQTGLDLNKFLGFSPEKPASGTILHELFHLLPFQFPHSRFSSANAMVGGLDVSDCQDLGGDDGGVRSHGECVLALGLDCALSGNSIECTTNPETLAEFAYVCWMYDNYPGLDLMIPSRLLSWQRTGETPLPPEDWAMEDLEVQLTAEVQNLQQTVPPGLAALLANPTPEFTNTISLLEGIIGP